MTPAKPSLRPQDIRLLVGFAYFVEIALVYLFLIDPPLTQLGRAEQQVKLLKVGHHALLSTKQARDGQNASRRLPKPLACAPGEAPGMAVRRFLDAQLRRERVTPLAWTVELEREPPKGWSTYRSALSLTGPYSASSSLVRHVTATDVLLTLDHATIRPSRGQPGEVDTELTFTFYFPAPQGEPTTTLLGMLNAGLAKRP